MNSGQDIPVKYTSQSFFICLKIAKHGKLLLGHPVVYGHGKRSQKYLTCVPDPNRLLLSIISKINRSSNMSVWGHFHAKVDKLPLEEQSHYPPLSSPLQHSSSSNYLKLATFLCLSIYFVTVSCVPVCITVSISVYRTVPLPLYHIVYRHHHYQDTCLIRTLTYIVKVYVIIKNI